MAVELYTHSLYSDANLQSYYRLESDGTDSKASYTLTNYNGSFTTGLFGNGFDANGSWSGNKCLYRTGAFPYSISGDLTVIGWFYFASQPGEGQNGAPYDLRDGSRYLLMYYYTSSGAQHLTLDASGNTINYDSTISATVWHQIAITNASGGAVIVYLDGSSIANGTRGSSGAGNGFVLGAFANLAGGINGNIDDVAFFDRVLTPTEISDFYNATGGETPAFIPKVMIF